MDFKEQLELYTTTVNTSFERFLSVEDVPERNLLESMMYSLKAGGKRLRPALIMACYQLFSQDYEEVIPFAIAMEMVHTFSLIHDDLPAIDNDNLRRGKPTNHVVYGESCAILAGDALLNKAYEIMLEYTLNNPNKYNTYISAMNVIANGVSRMIVGEHVDIECEGKNISKGMLDYMHSNKTGEMITAACVAGAILGSASDYQIDVITRYAKNIGLAFQIKDDILSEVGDQEKLGKPIGNDKEMNKSTYVTILGLEKSREILDNTIEDAVDLLSRNFGGNAQFLIDLAKFIKDREN